MENWSSLGIHIKALADKTITQKWQAAKYEVTLFNPSRTSLLDSRPEANTDGRRRNPVQQLHLWRTLMTVTLSCGKMCKTVSFVRSSSVWIGITRFG